MSKKSKSNDIFENEAVVYLRYSTRNQTDLSIEYQRERADKYCADKGYHVVKYFVDEAKSGTSDKRGKLQEMVEEAHHEPPWRKVIVFSFNRFARNVDLNGFYKITLKKLGITIESATENNENSPEANLERNVMASYDAYMPERCAVHTHASLKTKAQKCLHCGGKPPLGFDIKDEKLVINPYEAETVRMIFDMYDKNYSYNDMMKVLNEQGRTTKKGSQFSKNSFYSILHQEKYKGVFVWNRAAGKQLNDTHNTHNSKPLKEQVRIVGGCKSIIDKEVFDRVQQKMNNNRVKNMRSVGRYHYMLGGMGKIYCSECGALMVGSSYKSHDKNYRYYICPNHKQNECTTKNLRASYIEHVISMTIVNKILTKNNYDLYNDLLKRCFDTKADVALKKELSSVSKAINNILEVLETTPTVEVQERLETLSKKKESILCSLEEHHNVLQISRSKIKEVKKALYKELINSLDPVIYDIINNTVKKIIVSNDEIQIELNI